MNQKKMIKAVIFDLDGTLTDTEKYYQISWTEALKHFGYSPTAQTPLLLRSLGSPFAYQQLCKWFGDDFPFTQVREYRDQIMVRLVNERGISLKPGCVELLEWLKEHNVTIALATSGVTERADRFLNAVDIRKYFDYFSCSDKVRIGKPAPETYQIVCKGLGILPESTFAVEDSPNGVLSAHGAGCNVVMVPDLTPPDEELRKKLYACVDTLADIITLVEQFH